MICNDKKIEVVQVPGVAGSNGINAFTVTTASFTVPAIGSNVSVVVANDSWMVAGQSVIVGAPANFKVSSFDIPSLTAVLTFLGNAGDVSPGTVIAAGASVAPTGAPGKNGQNGFAITTSNFTVPSVGSTVTVPVDDSSAFVAGEFAIATGPANFKVSAIPNPTSITLQFLGNTGDVSPGATVASGSTITSAGSAGQNAFTKLTAQLTVPAIGATVTAAVLSTAWMAQGQNVVIAAPASFSVTTINSPTSVTLTFLGYFGDVVPTTIIANGSTVTPTGTQPAAGNTVSATLGSPFTIPVTTPTDIGVSLTLPQTGNYNLTAFLNTIFSSDYNGAASENPVVLTIYRSNNTPTDLTSVTLYPITGTNPSSGSRVTWGIFPMQISPLAATAGDQIGIKASFQTALQGGTIIINAVSLVAQQIG